METGKNGSVLKLNEALELKEAVELSDGSKVETIGDALFQISRLSKAVVQVAETVECSEAILWDGIWPAFSLPCASVHRLADEVLRTLNADA